MAPSIGATGSLHRVTSDRVELEQAAVFLDFDGTVTLSDTGRHVLERLGKPQWRALDADYAAGRIGSRECISRQWELVSGGLDAARPVAREIAIDPDFVALARELTASGAELTVVSDGFGFRATEVCEAAGVAVLTNRIDASGRLEFPWLDRCCACSSCGVCKQAPIKDARRRGRRTVLVGDGISDRKAALLAEVIFAKSDLADFCDEAGVDYRPFHRLHDVGRALLGWR